MERNIKLTLEYDGSEYGGWQIQKHTKTVQGTLKKNVEKILKHRINIIGASRTDSGVHALGQIANFRTYKNIPLYKLQRALNGYLPPDIKVIKAEEAPLNFHARFDSKGKTYVYKIFNRNTSSPFKQKRAWFIPQALDIETLQNALNYFTGTHDFTTFSKISKDEEINPIRTVDKITTEREKNLISVTITGRSFLRHMIRVIVATCVKISMGKIPLEAIPRIFAEKNRKSAPFLAPAEGLYLMKVYYNDYPYQIKSGDLCELK